MKYFARFLPVEGEIKERDWYKSPSGGILSQHNGSELLPDGWYKVKLYLCSRDNPDEPIGMINPNDTWIKEGDEFSEDEISRAFVGDKLKTGTVQIKCRCCGRYSSL